MLQSYSRNKYPSKDYHPRFSNKQKYLKEHMASLLKYFFILHTVGLSITAPMSDELFHCTGTH